MWCSFTRREHGGAATDALQRMGVEVWYAPFLDGVASWLRTHGGRFHVALLVRHHVAHECLPLLKRYAPQARTVFDTVDLHYLRERRGAEVAGDAGLLRAAERTRASELAVMEQCDVTVLVSSAEREQLQADAPTVRVELISNLHDIAGAGKPFEQRHDGVRRRLPPPAEPGRDGMVHRRSLRRHPRPPARCAPALHRRCRAGIPAGPGRAPAGVQMHGFVEDITPYMDGARISIAPLRFGAGVKGKINLSMAHGQPVVGTPARWKGCTCARARTCWWPMMRPASPMRWSACTGSAAVAATVEAGLANIAEHFSSTLRAQPCSGVFHLIRRPPARRRRSSNAGSSARSGCSKRACSAACAAKAVAAAESLAADGQPALGQAQACRGRPQSATGSATPAGRPLPPVRGSAGGCRRSSRDWRAAAAPQQPSPVHRAAPVTALRAMRRMHCGRGLIHCPERSARSMLRRWSRSWRSRCVLLPAGCCSAFCACCALQALRELLLRGRRSAQLLRQRGIGPPPRTGSRRPASGCVPAPPATSVHGRAGRWHHRPPLPERREIPLLRTPAARAAGRAGPGAGAARRPAPMLPGWRADQHGRHRTGAHAAVVRRPRPARRVPPARACCSRSLSASSRPSSAGRLSGCSDRMRWNRGSALLSPSSSRPAAKALRACASSAPMPAPALRRARSWRATASASPCGTCSSRASASACALPSRSLACIFSRACCGPPRRYGPGLRGPADDLHPAPARPGSARAHHCHRRHSAARPPVRHHLRPAAARSEAHPRTSRPAACAAAPAAQTPPAPRPAPSATPGARGVPAATTNGLRGGRGPAQITSITQGHKRAIF